MLKIFESFQQANLFKPWLKQTVIRVVILCGLITAFSGQLPDSHFFEDRVSYMPLHTALEFFAIAIGILIFAVVWHTRDKHRDGRNLFLASLFLGVALLDFFHTMSFFGMPDFITPNVPGKAISFWFAGRLMAVVGLLGAVLYSFTILQKTAAQLLLLTFIVLLVILAAWAQLFHPDLLPDFFIPGKGLTATKVNIEYFISALCLIAALIMLYKSEHASNKYWLYLGCAALIMMFSEFYFTLYAKVTDIYNLLGHLYKIIAYSMVYQAVFVSSVREPYWQIELLQKKQQKIAEQLQEAQKIAHLGQWELEYPGYRLTWSSGIFELFEIDPAKFGASYEAFLELCHPDDRKNIDQYFTDSLRNGTPYEYVHRLLMKDGRIKWVRESGYTAYGADGEPVYTKGTVLEVTGIVEMEASLRDSERHYRTITESIGVPLAVNDQNGNITFLNSSFVQTFGYTREDIPTVAQWWPLAYPDPAYREEVIRRWWERLEQMRQGQSFLPIEINITCKNGQVRTVLSSSVPLSATDNLIYLYDISELKQAESETYALREQLAQAGKMEALGHLTAGIAHDFNNILGAIMGYTELSQHMLAAGTPDSVARYQEEILKASTRAKELIAQMLAFSRLAPEGQDKNAPVLALSTVVKEVVSLLRFSIPRGIALNFRVDAECSVCIRPVHLNQIILNLGINARDAIGDQGSIDISVDKLHAVDLICTSCNNYFAGDYARISVKDSGSGIPEQILGKIFDPFFTTKGVGKGTGMGLSVVHGLVHSLGGHLQVQTKAGSGTEFSILLPLVAPGDNAQEQAEAAPVLSVQEIKIMVVDDEYAMASMLHEFLSVYGVHVVSYTDPLLALEAFSAQAASIDLVITDETMPGISGMHLAEALLKIKPQLPVILCTGHSDHATPESASAIGIAGFFYKPLRMNELLLKIQTLTGARDK